jgi:hypothetical protein
LKFSKLMLFSFALFSSISGCITPILIWLFIGDMTSSMMFSSDFMSLIGNFVFKILIVIVWMSVVMVWIIILEVMENPI